MDESALREFVSDGVVVSGATVARMTGAEGEERHACVLVVEHSGTPRLGEVLERRRVVDAEPFMAGYAVSATWSAVRADREHGHGAIARLDLSFTAPAALDVRLLVPVPSALAALRAAAAGGPVVLVDRDHMPRTGEELLRTGLVVTPARSESLRAVVQPPSAR
jgi:hypothetical protein